MSLVVVDEGALRSCGRLASAWPDARRVGLLGEDLVADRHATIANIVPATFSGYDGERAIEGWSLPVMEGDRAVSRATPVIWTYDGSSPSGYVFGYYVVDEDGALLHLEKRVGGPVAMVASGQQYKVVPVLTAGTRFGGET